MPITMIMRIIAAPIRVPISVPREMDISAENAGLPVTVPVTPGGGFDATTTDFTLFGAAVLALSDNP
jgi:hypothetical protein